MTKVMTKVDAEKNPLVQMLLGTIVGVEPRNVGTLALHYSGGRVVIFQASQEGLDFGEEKLPRA